MLNLGGVTFTAALDERRTATIRQSRLYRACARGAGMLPFGRERARQTPPPERRVLDPAAFASAEARRIVERANGVQWYHTIDLPCGIATPGLTDHRTQLGHYGLPDDMRGMRALDVATFDGFWAFEMERRGAEVVCIDIPSVQCADIPDRIRDRLSPDQDHATGDGFRLAHELLGSRVERRELSVYDLDPEAVGKFDVVLMSDLLLHLRDPMRALERVYSVVRDGGHAIIAEPHNPELDVLGESAVQQLLGYERYVWGTPSATLLRRMLSVAGFGQVDEVSRFRLNYRGTFPLEKIVLRAYPWQRRLLETAVAESATVLMEAR